MDLQPTSANNFPKYRTNGSGKKVLSVVGHLSNSRNKTWEGRFRIVNIYKKKISHTRIQDIKHVICKSYKTISLIMSLKTV